MSSLESLFAHVTIAKRITDRLSDVDVRRLASDPYWSIFHILSGGYWRKRAQKHYCRSKLGSRLIQEVNFSTVDDYCEFLCILDSIKRCDTKYKLKSFLTQHLENGPGTEPLVRGRTSLSFNQIVWSSSATGSIVMNTETDTVRILTAPHLNIRLFGVGGKKI